MAAAAQTRSTNNTRSSTQAPPPPPRPPLGVAAASPAMPRPNPVPNNEDPEISIVRLAHDLAFKFPVSSEATEALVKIVMTNQVYIQHLVHTGAVQKIAAARSSMRETTSMDWLGARRRGLERHAAAVNGRASLFDSWKMPGSDVSIGDATQDDLTNAIEYHRIRRDAEDSRADAYERIRTRLMRSKQSTVRDAFRETDLAKILRPIEEP